MYEYIPERAFANNHHRDAARQKEEPDKEIRGSNYVRDKSRSAQKHRSNPYQGG